MYVYMMMMLIYDVPRLSLNIPRKAIFCIVKSIAGSLKLEVIDFFGLFTELLLNTYGFGNLFAGHILKHRFFIFLITSLPCQRV